MVKALLILATIVDVALAALLIGVSGFLFGCGSRKHARRARRSSSPMWAAVIACVAAPIAGFVIMRRGKPVPGIIVAWMPTAGALAAMLLPPPY